MASNSRLYPRVPGREDEVVGRQSSEVRGMGEQGGRSSPKSPRPSETLYLREEARQGYSGLVAEASLLVNRETWG